MTTNLFPQELLNAMAAAEATISSHGTTELIVDVNRTDTYVANGTATYPYKTITAAMVVANANADSTHPYLVTVLPGIYSEAPFTINPFIKVSGAGRVQTHIYASLLTAHFITMSPSSRIDNCTIWGPTDPNVAGIYVATGGEVIRLGDVAFSRGYYGVLCNQGTTGHIVLENVVFADEGEHMDTFLRVTNHSHVFFIDSRIEGDDEHVQIGAEVDGADARLTVTDLYHQVFGAATVGVRVDNSATLRVSGGVFMGGHTAMEVGSGGSPNLHVQAAMIHRALGVPSNYTHDIDVQTISATVTFAGFASRDKFNNPFNCPDIYANFLNHETGNEGSCSLGELIVGDTSAVMPLLDYGKSAYLTGLVSGGEVEIGAGLNVIVRAGYGYINDPAITSPIRVEWDEDLHFLLADDTEEQTIYIDNTGTICKSTLSVDYGTNIVLAKATTAGTAVKLLTQDEISISHVTSRLADFFEHVIGPLTASGCNVTKTGGNSYKIDVNGGTFLVGLSERDITGAVGTAFTYVYQSAPGVWTYNAATIIDKDHYDNGTGPTDFGADDWKKDVVYLIKNGGGEQYFVVMGQTAYTDQTAALAGALPSAPDLLTEYGLRVAAIVTHKEAADIDTVVDIRPFLGQNAPVATTAAVNHDDLANRNLDNNHTQYHTDARAVTWLATQPGNTTNLVTDGNDHDHTGGAGAQISHTNLSDKGTTTHANIDLFIGSKAAASGLASLDGSSKVVQDPANATATPTASKIPIADASALLDGWVSSGAAAATPSLRKIGTGALEACAGNDSRLSNDRTPTAHKTSHISGADQLDDATGLVHGLMTAAHYTKLDNITSDAVAGTASLRTLGTTATSACAGNDSRLSTPSNATATPTASKIPIADASALLDGWVSSGAAAATASLRKIGTGALEACAGNDSRLATPSNATATPTAGKIPIADGSGKLDGWITSATVFGSNYQTAISTGRTTYSTDVAFQTKVTLTTGALTGTYRVGWSCVLDGAVTNQNFEAQLYNVTDAAIVGVVRNMRPSNVGERYSMSGFAEVTFTGALKSFAIQYRTTNSGNAVGISDARIEIWRVA